MWSSFLKLAPKGVGLSRIDPSWHFEKCVSHNACTHFRKLAHVVGYYILIGVREMGWLQSANFRSPKHMILKAHVSELIFTLQGKDVV